MPLFVKNELVACFCLFAKDAGFFNNDEISLLNELADNISHALEHIAVLRRLEKLTRIRSVLGAVNTAIVRIFDQQALFEECCRISDEVGQIPFTWIGIYSQAEKMVRPVAWAGSATGYHKLAQEPRPVDKAKSGEYGIVAMAITHRKPMIINDINEGSRTIYKSEHLKLGMHSLAVFPLFASDEVSGVFVLHGRETGYFDDEEIKLFTELADNISFTLEHIEQQKKLAKLTRIRTVLSKINTAILHIDDKQELLYESCRIATEAGSFHFAWIGTFDPNKQQVMPVAWAAPTSAYLDYVKHARHLDVEKKRRMGIIARAVLERKAMIINDMKNDPRANENHRAGHLERGTQSLAVLPLIVSDAVAGVFLLHATEYGFFDDEEVKLLSELSENIGFALQTIDSKVKLDYLSRYDPVTGLPNRVLFSDRIAQFALLQKTGCVALIVFNIVRFRNINESFGRTGGDKILSLVAKRLEAEFNGKDLIARIGSDNFGVIALGIDDAASAARVVENKVLACFNNEFHLNDSELRLTANAGIAIFPDDGSDADTLIKNAEVAQKQANAGKDRFMFYSPAMNARAAQWLRMETRLRKAIEAQEFVLHYQPKYNLASGRICGMEALIRWQDPERGLIPPADFIPLLEETGLILEVGQWAISQALNDYCRWKTQGCTVPRVAVNISAIQMQRKGFLNTIIDSIQQAGDIPEALELEVTESLLMKNFTAATQQLGVLRGMGVLIAMDDFGTGYSSLSYLSRLPIDTLKIDRSFIIGLCDNANARTIVSTIINLAHSLKMQVVAEGTEEEEQVKILRSLNCDQAQGFFFSKPLPPEEMASLLHSQNKEKAETN
jgi:diguanylate cyclase (GGDEF)-like protein